MNRLAYERMACFYFAQSDFIRGVKRVFASVVLRSETKVTDGMVAYVLVVVRRGMKIIVGSSVCVLAVGNTTTGKNLSRW